MKVFKVSVSHDRVVSFYVQADSEASVRGFMENNLDWKPGDVDGLVDGDVCNEVGFDIEESTGITANFHVNAELELQEND